MPDYTTPIYTAPKTGTGSTSGTTTNTANGQSGSWLDWVNLGLQWYNSQKDPKTKNIPLSPEQKALFDAYLGSLMNPALKDNAAKANQFADDWIGQHNNVSWTSPKTFSGDVGYQGSPTRFTPPPTGGLPPNGQTPPPTPGTPRIPPPSTGDDIVGGKSLPNLRLQLPPVDGNPGLDAVNDEAYNWRRANGGKFKNPWDPEPPPSGGSYGDPPSGHPFIGDEDWGPQEFNPTQVKDWGGFMGILGRIVGPLPKDEEGIEKWASRGASIIAGSMGLPIPAGLIDKGWDALQWIYRQITGQPPPTPPPTNP